MSAVKDLRIYQAAREAAYGTAIATTNRLVTDLEIKPVEQVISAHPQIGVLLANPTTDQIARRSSEMKLSGELTYEQILYLLEASIDGNVSPSGGGADKTWAYTSLYTGDPALKSFCLQRRMTDGSTTWDEGVAYALVKDFKLSAAIGELVKFDSNWFGRPVDTAVGLTGAIAIPTVNFVSAADVKWYFDTSFANLGTTQLLGDVISWDINVEGVYQPKFYQDGRTDRSYSTHGLKRQDYNATLQVEWNAQINGFRTQAAARSLLYCRMAATGAALGGSNYKIQCDFIARFKEAQFDSSGDRDGNDMATLEFVSAYDPAQTLGMRFSIVNALGAWV